MITNDKFTRPTGVQQKSNSKYRDITLDLQPDDSPPGVALHGSNIKHDVKLSYDEGAIMNSLRNIFTTSPGQKVLNPEFGINLSRWLFEPCTEFTAREIAEVIIAGIEKHEPRVAIKTIQVIANKEQHEYSIQLVITIPALSIIDKTYDAILNQPGFSFLTETTL